MCIRSLCRLVACLSLTIATTWLLAWTVWYSAAARTMVLQKLVAYNDDGMLALGRQTSTDPS